MDVAEETVDTTLTPPPTPPVEAKQYVCKQCGALFSGFSELGTHTKKSHPAPKKEAEGTPRLPKEPEVVVRLTEEDVRTRIALDGRPYLNTLKKERLEQLLDAPRISPNAKTYVLAEWERNDLVKDNPQELLSLLIKEVGIEELRSIRIVQNVFSLEQRYGDLLAQRGEDVIIWPQTSARPQPRTIYLETPQEPQPRRILVEPQQVERRRYPPQDAPHARYDAYGREYYEDYSRSSPPYVSPESLSKTVAESVTKSLEAKFTSLEQRLGTLESKGEEKMVVSEEPVMDFEGKPITDDQGRHIMRRIARPLSAFGSGSQDNVSQLFRYVDRKFEELKQSTPPQQQGETPVERELRLRLESAQKTLEQIVVDNKELRKKYEENKDAHVQAQLQRQEKDMADLRTYARSVEEKLDEERSRRSGEGYKEDSYRIIGEGLHAVAKKEPIKVIIEGVKDIVGVTPRRREERTDLANLLPAEYVSES